MPYAKTKEGSLVNEVTLGDGYPLSNDLQPLKIGGEASILGISSPLPDGSDSGLFRVDGDLDITGTLKTKLSHDLIYDFDDEVNTLAQAKVDALIDSAPAALDTLNELAAALGDDASFATTVTNSIATKVGLTGNETVAGHKKFSDDVLIAGTAADTGTDSEVSLGVNSAQLRVHTNHGYVQIGPSNSNWSHFYTDRTKYYFNTSVTVDTGVISSYNEDVILRRSNSSDNQLLIGDDSLAVTLGGDSRLSVDADGQVDLTGDLMLRGEGGIFVENSDTTRGGSIIQPAGGMYRTASNAHTGAIKIALPTGTGQVADMISFWVDVFDYGVGQSFSVYVGGYVYQDEGSNEWVNESATVFGNLSDKDFSVRFGHDESNHCVLIGEVDSTWNYPQVTVRNVQVGYVSDIDDWTGNWAITFETSLPTIDETETTNFPATNNLVVTDGDSDGTSFPLFVDSATGILAPHTNSEFVFDASNSRLGIGTDPTPNYRLHVKGTGWGSQGIGIQSDGTNGAVLSLITTQRAFEISSRGNGFNIRDTDGDTSRFNINSSGTASFEDNDITNVGDIALDTISSDAGTSIGVILGTDAGDDFIVDTDTLVVEGDNNRVGIGTTSPTAKLHLDIDTEDNQPALLIEKASDSGETALIVNHASSSALRGIADFQNASGTVMKILADGNVGIGTASPSTELEVDGTITATSIDAGTIYNTSLAIGRDSTDQIDFSSDNQIRFKVGNANEVILNVNSLYPSVNDGTALGGTSNNYSDLYLASGGTINWNNGDIVATHSSNALGITGGNVGIGTASPSATLDVAGDVNFTGDLTINAPASKLLLTGEDTSGNHAIQSDANLYLDIDSDNDSSSNFFQFRAYATNLMKIQDDGNVGIGTTSPTTTLDVEGTVSYKHTAFTTAGPTDNVDVSDTTVLEVDTSGGSVTIGGFTGGVQGQILYVIKTTSDVYTLKLENSEGGGSQDIFSSTNSDISLVRIRGGVTLYCNGTSWFVLNK